ncbi:ADP-ribosyltransferase [Actinoallomurus sp. CA-142502]|uniref:ADP-ribosyltransferase n=1 Tax=Actinoallomurus sp. CA-142502 TaxID=3239885 RepID=UPI003D8CA623
MSQSFASAPFGSRSVSPSYGDRIWGEYVEKMAGRHYMAIDTYSSNERYINRYLRDADYFDRLEQVWSMAPTIRESTLAQIQAIREVMRLRPVPDTIDVFRAVKMKPGIFTVPIEELPGTIQRDPAFLSTNLGDRPAYERDIILHLRVPEGTPGFYIEPISKMGEHELLLDAGRSWFAEDVLRRERQWHVYGWVLPD